MKKFSEPVIRALKYYIYLYSHPVTNEIFYVGKGRGNRIFHHLKEKGSSAKVNYIQELASSGLKPKLEILIHGLENEVEALRVESSIIDLLGRNNLTNLQSGYHSSSFGRMSLKQINALYDKEKVVVDDPVLLIRINKAFRYTMTAMELYDYTRGRWVLSIDRAKKVKYALAVYEGIVQEVYEIIDWFKAGTTFSVRNMETSLQLFPSSNLENRFEFVGNIASDLIRSKYRYKSVEHYFKQGNANPIMYVNS